MRLFTSDPLLAFCKLLAWLILLGCAGSIVMALLFAAAGLFGGNWFEGVLRQSYPALKDGAQIAFGVAMIFIVAGLGLVFQFMRKLLAIIGAIQAGEAFSLANAARIRTMAWISLIGIAAGAVIGMALSAAVQRLGPEVADAGIHIRPLVGWEPGFGQILMTLLLFVLARLFTQAATMRDEIEGTV